MSELNQFLWRCGSCGNAAMCINPQSVYCPHCHTHYSIQDGIWECADNFTPPGFHSDRCEHVLELEQHHFWFKARDRLLLHKLKTLRHSNENSLLELGCGSGRVLADLSNDFSKTAGIEGHIGPLERARLSSPNSLLLHADVLASPLADQQFDWVTAFDVLEHVEAPLLLKEAYRLTRPAGRMLLSVPAFPILWSHVDQVAGHRCRYRLQQLESELSSTGWRLQGYTYFQFFLFPLLAASRILNRNAQPHLEHQPPKMINFLLGAINQLEVSLFAQYSLPFGSSLIAWADKQEMPYKEAHERTTQ